MQPRDAPRFAGSTVVDSVMLAVMAVGRLVRQRAEGDELDPGIFWLLKTVATQGPMRVTELAGCTNLDTSTVSRHIGQLDRSGLVERTPDPDDGRAHRIRLTSEGERILQDAFDRRRALLRRGLAEWHDDDIADLDRLLGRFVVDIEKLNADLEPA